MRIQNSPSIALAGIILVMTATSLAGDPASPGRKKPFLHLQLGYLGRLSDEPYDDNILTGELALLFPRSERTSLGLGFRAAGSEGAVRCGIKGIWRRKFSPTSRFYYQLGPGIYLGGDEDRFNFPAGFLEAEIGFTNFLAVATIIEVKSVKRKEYHYYSGPLDGTTKVIEGTDVSWFLGVKGGQWPVAVVAVLAGLISQINLSMGM